MSQCTKRYPCSTLLNLVSTIISLEIFWTGILSLYAHPQVLCCNGVKFHEYYKMKYKTNRVTFKKPCKCSSYYGGRFIPNSISFQQSLGSKCTSDTTSKGLKYSQTYTYKLIYKKILKITKSDKTNVLNNTTNSGHI